MHVKRDGLTPSMRHGRFLLVPLIVVAAIVAMAGCASPATFQPASGGQNFPPFEGEVRVLENLPSSDQYTRVGIVKVEGVLLTKEAEMVAERLQLERPPSAAQIEILDGWETAPPWRSPNP